jgi:hypothetical protein
MGESEAVTYFSDGGFGFTNNPTFEGITEITSLHGEENLGAVVNVGTSRRKRKAGGKSLSEMIHESFDISTDPNHVAEKVDRLDLPYYWRLNDEDGIEVDLDEWKPNGYFSKNPGAKTLGKIKSKFHEWAVHPDNSECLRSCAKELVARRRARIIDLAKWEVYATSASYSCNTGGCRNKHYADRAAFKTHLKNDHSISDVDIQSTVIEATEMWQYQIPPTKAGRH